MDINPATAWWIVAGVLVAVELATGSFYLLMLAFGCAAGALAAHLGAGMSAQQGVAALVGGSAVTIWHVVRGRRGSGPPAAANPDVNIDIGQQVEVEHWGTDGQTQVRYRGARWRARYVGAGTPGAGLFTIRALEGSCLLLDR